MIDKEKIENAVEMLLQGIGEDPNREGLKDTPQRIARMFQEIFAGMEEEPSKHLSKTFQVENNEMVMERDITFHSMCEHHLMPFFGKVHIAYVPNGKVVGISKLARTVEVFARRLQIQEKMTAQIAHAIMNELNPKGVMVMVEAEHLCMSMRGIKKPGTNTVTVVKLGEFEENREKVEDFYRMLR
ncbi:GTP cyclohydrolase I [Hathewaya proteolytica DSM 3090]|uniref:GTP cyclohydrolase 1 n=1 Tax=Hathewaya proteolytica DSM 3090 TaxID=1121331 RepID=A0A1M6N6S5_9CLOT|nr:GTP cyclohydrolase I FolE [Hathewaya proteolytica]SHJ91256.1 GTP cyclohydrolase I [Hathewaya proteolytica DSM 3090]